MKAKSDTIFDVCREASMAVKVALVAVLERTVPMVIPLLAVEASLDKIPIMLITLLTVDN